MSPSSLFGRRSSRIEQVFECGQAFEIPVFTKAGCWAVEALLRREAARLKNQIQNYNDTCAFQIVRLLTSICLHPLSFDDPIFFMLGPWHRDHPALPLTLPRT
jgi:hypothetical protein